MNAVKHLHGKGKKRQVVCERCGECRRRDLAFGIKTLNDDRLRHFCGDRDQVNPKGAIEIDFAVTTSEYMVGVASNTFLSNIK